MSDEQGGRSEGDDFDARFFANPRSVRRFRRIEAPFHTIAASAASLLDLGCGTGRLLADLPAPAIRVGIDISDPLLRRALSRGLPVLRADAHALPFADASFDAVIAANAVFRYLRVPAAFAECHRVLRPGGRLAIHHYAAHTLSLRRAARRPFHPAHLRSLSNLRTPAAAAGFTEESLDLWRGIRVPPYALRIPEFVAAPLHLWDHAVFIFRRR